MFPLVRAPLSLNAIEGQDPSNPAIPGDSKFLRPEHKMLRINCSHQIRIKSIHVNGISTHWTLYKPFLKDQAEGEGKTGLSGHKSIAMYEAEYNKKLDRMDEGHLFLVFLLLTLFSGELEIEIPDSVQNSMKAPLAQDLARLLSPEEQAALAAQPAQLQNLLSRFGLIGNDIDFTDTLKTPIFVVIDYEIIEPLGGILFVTPRGENSQTVSRIILESTVSHFSRLLYCCQGRIHVFMVAVSRFPLGILYF